ncbi:fumarylacetoacetate hydrolase family protein [Desulfovibrio sp. OttesenSCG-928-O18]|nr:fumarylacetoacetate hydrolase family protein [Desulfovibrio sp. OttesenSCG-928-O18]
MRFVMFLRDGEKGIAASDGGVFRGYCENEAGYPGDLDDLIATGEDMREVAEDLLAGVDIDLESCEYLPPLMRPSKIICVGLNYADHSKEIGFEVPAYPTVFCRFPSSLVGHGQPIIKPLQSDQLDYEGELVAVIGKRARAVPEDKALEYVAGYSLFNDASIRDYQFLTPQWTVGKNFDGSGPFGPWLVTPDELPPGGKGLAITTRLNGAVMQQSTTDCMMFGVANLIALLSETMTLEPGDVLVTGTPSGVGTSRKPPVFMKDGDVVEVEVEKLGVLRNPVVAAK